MDCHYTCSPTTTMTTTTTTPYDPIAACEGSCAINCGEIENHYQRNHCLLICYTDCSATTTKALTTTTMAPTTTTTHPFAMCHTNCETHCAQYKNHDDELNCLTHCFTNCIPTTITTTTPSASELCYHDCNTDCPEYDSMCLVACYHDCLALIPTTSTTTTTTTTSTTSTSTITTSTTTRTTTSTTTSTTISTATEEPVPEVDADVAMGWLELLGLAVLAAVMTVVLAVLVFRGENIYKWCRRGCRPKKSRSRRVKVKPADVSPKSSEHLIDENHELNSIKAENKRIVKAIEKINDQENERLREQLRRVERATAEPIYPPEYSRAYDSYRRESYYPPSSRRLMDPRREPFYRSSFTGADEHDTADEDYKEPLRAARFVEQERPIRQRREFDQAARRVQPERYNKEPSKPVKSNRITDERRQYARKKSKTGLNAVNDEFDREDETAQRRPIEDQPVRGARRPIENEANQRKLTEDQPIRARRNQQLDEKPRKAKEPESDLSDY